MRTLLVLLVALVASGGIAAASPGSSIKLTEVRYPKATAVPAGSRMLKAGVLFWSNDVTSLSASDSTLYIGTSTSVQQVNAASTTFGAQLLRGAEAADIVSYEGDLWAADYDAAVVREIDEATGQVVATVQLGVDGTPESLAVADGSIWVAEHHRGVVARIDPATATVTASVSVEPPQSGGPQGLAYGAGSLWLTLGNIGQVVRIDPTTDQIVARIHAPSQMQVCGGIAVGVTSVWVTSCLEETIVIRISTATNKVVSLLDLHQKSVQPATQGDTAWFVVGRDPGDPNAGSQHAYLVQLSNRDRVLRRYDLGSHFTAGDATVAFGSLWASSWGTPWLARVPLP